MLFPIFIDSQHLIVAAQGIAFAEHGLAPPSRATALSVVGLSLPQAFRRLVGDDGPIEGLSESYKRAFNTLRLDPAREFVAGRGHGDHAGGEQHESRRIALQQVQMIREAVALQPGERRLGGLTPRRG